MGPQQVGSFIPKSPVGSRPSDRKRPSQKLGRFGVISLIVFLIIGGASIGMFVWKLELTQSLEEKEVALNARRQEIQSGEVALLVNTDNKIEQAKGILNDHVSVVDFFDLIGDYTVRSVAFRNMRLSGTPGSPYELSISGIGNDLASLIVQSEVLKDPELNNRIVSSSLSSAGAQGLEDEVVGFTVTATVDPRVLDFQSSLPSVEEESELEAALETIETEERSEEEANETIE